MTRWGLGLAVAVLLLGASARGQKPLRAQDRKAAKAHFQQGRAFYEAGAWDDAVRAYEQAYALVPLPELLFNLGQASRMKNDKQRALDAYLRYLTAAPDGPLAEEARNHVAALRLRIQVDEAEAARKKAAAEAETARRQAAEAEAARRRTEAEAVARLRSQREDEERLRRLAAQEAERARQQRAADAVEHRRRLEEARDQGGGLRTAGAWMIVAGSLTLGASLIPALQSQSAGGKISEYDESDQPWSVELEQAVRDQDAGVRHAIILASIGGGLIVTGIVLQRIGAYQRNRAVEEVPPATYVAPGLGPGWATLTIVGGF